MGVVGERLGSEELREHNSGSRQPQLREEIERLRQSPRHARPIAQPAQRATADSLRQQVHGYRDEIARLQAENRSLKDQLARQLGATRAASVTKRP